MQRPAWLLTLALAACGAQETCPEGQADRGPASSASAWVEAAAPGDLALLQAAARVVLTGDRQAAIRPLYRAQIVRFHVQAGDRVTIGQPLVDVIMPEVVAAAANYRGASARSGAQGARRDKLTAMRGEGLVAEGAVFDVASRAAESEQQVLLAAATLRAAGLDPARAREQLRDPVVHLTSPIDGVVRELGGRLGDIVEGQGPPIALVIGEGVPRVEARFLRAPPTDSSVRFVGVDGQVWPLQREPLARVVESDDGAVVQWYAVADDRRSFPGLRGTVECLADDPGVVQVPADALGRRGDGLVIHREDGDVPVELLTASGAAALVRAVAPASLAVGDRIAADARAHERAARSGAGG